MCQREKKIRIFVRRKKKIHTMAENLREQYDSPEEREYEKALRPLSFDDFAGQEQILSNPGGIRKGRQPTHRSP